MSINNYSNAVKGKVYSQKDRLPSLNCGGKLDKEGIDSYWGASKTVQADEKDANISKIMSKYHLDGKLPNIIKSNPIYGDFSSVESYQESMNLVMKANEQFMALGPKVREKFQNDPSKMLEFVKDAKNHNELVELGLAIPKPYVEPKNPPNSVNHAPPASSAPEKV